MFIEKNVNELFTIFLVHRPSTAPTSVASKTSIRTGWSAAVASKPVKTQHPTSSLAKTKSNSSSNLYNGKDSGSHKPVIGGRGWTESQQKDLRANRVSLVARQARFSVGTPPLNNVATANGNSGPRTTGLMTRSATSATLSNRGRIVAFGRGAVMSSTTSRVQPRNDNTSTSHRQTR